MQNVIGLILVYAVIAVSLLVSVHLKRNGSKIDPRKVTHIGVGNFVFIWWMFSEGWVMLAFFADGSTRNSLKMAPVNIFNRKITGVSNVISHEIG